MYAASVEDRSNGRIALYGIADERGREGKGERERERVSVCCLCTYLQACSEDS